MTRRWYNLKSNPSKLVDNKDAHWLQAYAKSLVETSWVGAIALFAAIVEPVAQRLHPSGLMMTLHES